MQDLSQYVSSAQAVTILREAGRPRASRQTLVTLVRLGRVKPIRVHTRCNLYDRNEVAAVARALVAGGAA